METTIYKTVKGKTIESIFEECKSFSIRFFKALNLKNESDYQEEKKYKYEIKIRHAENTDANVLFEEERFKREILNKI